jgi:hypothetical protein
MCSGSFVKLDDEVSIGDSKPTDGLTPAIRLPTLAVGVAGAISTTRFTRRLPSRAKGQPVPVIQETKEKNRDSRRFATLVRNLAVADSISFKIQGSARLLSQAPRLCQLLARLAHSLMRQYVRSWWKRTRPLTRCAVHATSRDCANVPCWRLRFRYGRRCQYRYVGSFSASVGRDDCGRRHSHARDQQLTAIIGERSLMFRHAILLVPASTRGDPRLPLSRPHPPIRETTLRGSRLVRSGKRPRLDAGGNLAGSGESVNNRRVRTAHNDR